MIRKQMFLLVLLAMLSSLLIANELPAQGFENEDFPPSGWTNDGWQRKTYSTHTGGGVAMASFTAGTYKLITPQVTITENQNLNYWIRDYQDGWDNSSEYFEVKISTTGTEDADFGAVLQTLTGDEITINHTLQEVSLAAYAGQNVYIAFIWHAAGGNYAFVDDVEIVAAPQYRVELNSLTNTASVAAGSSYKYKLTVANTGAQNDTYSLSISNTPAFTYEISSGNVAINQLIVNSGRSKTFDVKVMVADGTATDTEDIANVLVQSETDNTASANIDLTTTSVNAKPMPYHEDFESVSVGASDVGWQTNFYVSTTNVPHGVNNSQGMYKYLDANLISGYAYSPDIALTGENMVIKFDYRYVDADDYPTVPIEVESGDTLRVSISNDNENYTELALIAEGGHTATTDFTTYMANIPSSYANSVAKFKFYVTWGAGLNRDYTIDIDNVKVENALNNDISVDFVKIPENTIFFNNDNLEVKAQVYNNGLIEQNNVEVSFKVANQVIASETIANIASNQTIQITKNWVIDVANPALANLVSVEVENDDFNENNIATVPISILPAGALVEGFNEEAFPEGWRIDEDSWEKMEYGFYEGGSYTQIRTNKTGKLITPKLDIINGSNIKFFAKSGYSGGNLVVKASTDLSTWVTVDSLTDISRSTWEERTVDLTSLAGNPHYIAFYKEAEGMVKIDFVTGPKIWVSAEPEFFVSEIDIDFGDINLNSSQAQSLYIQNAGSGNLTITALSFEDAAGFSLNPAFTGNIVLASGEVHNFEIIANTTTEGSFNTNLVIVDDIASSRQNHTVAVAANVIDTTIRTNHTESFEGALFPPVGWETIGWTKGNTGATGDYCARTNWEHDDPTYLVSPVIETTGNPSLSFSWKDADLEAATRVAGHDTTFVQIQTVGSVEWRDLYMLSNRTPMNNFETVYIDLANFANQAFRIRFKDVNDGTGSAYGTGIDDFTITVTMPLPVATNLQTELFEDNSVRLTWEIPAGIEDLNLTGFKVFKNDAELIQVAADILEHTTLPLAVGDYTFNVKAVYTEGISEASNTIEISITSTTDNNAFRTALTGNYPNPFNPSTNIAFSLKNKANVTLNIYNVKGQHVKTLVNKTFNAGNHTVNWNGKNKKAESVSSGIFFYKIQVGKYVATKKMILMK